MCYSYAVAKFAKKLGQVCTVLGAQWGDEGKGKLVDILAAEYPVILRATGGANAGHTIYTGGKKFVFHIMPSGILYPKNVCVIGNGLVIHLPTLFDEIDALKKSGISVAKRLVISDRAHILFDYHKLIDQRQEEMKGKSKVGTTGRGIGPCYTDKVARTGIRVGALLDWEIFEAKYKANVKLISKLWGFRYDGKRELAQLKKLLPRIKPLIVDTSLYVEEALTKKQPILIEGANGTLLDIDHGTFPYLTSSNASIGGIITGTGLPPRRLDSIIGIFKAYQTRVGSGPFPTELTDKVGVQIRNTGGEFGSTTGRPRRCGWFDAVAAQYAMRINGFTHANLTKVDVLNELPKIKIGIAYKYRGKKLKTFPADVHVLEKCTVEYEELPGWQQNLDGITTFEKLPKNCRAYIKRIEQLIGAPVSFIGTGKDRTEMIIR